MKTYELSNENGWVSIPATIKEVVAHFKDEHTEKMTLMDLLVLKPRVKNQITKIDCYEENEISNLSL